MLENRRNTHLTDTLFWEKNKWKWKDFKERKSSVSAPSNIIFFSYFSSNKTYFYPNKTISKQTAPSSSWACKPRPHDYKRTARSRLPLLLLNGRTASFARRRKSAVCACAVVAWCESVEWIEEFCINFSAFCGKYLLSILFVHVSLMFIYFCVFLYHTLLQ